MSGSLIKRSRAAMLVAAGAMALTMVSATGAQAATAAAKCTIKSYTPGKFAVKTTDTTHIFKVKTTGCTQKSWRIDLLADDQNVLLATKAKPVTTFRPAELDNALAGNYTVRVTVKSSTNKTTKKNFKFSLQRKSSFGSTFDAGPEQVTRGEDLTVVGTLKRASWGESPSNVPYANRSVQVQFKASGTKTFKNVTSVTTDADGNVSATVTATKSGAWRLHFAGNASTSSADSKVDGVTVN